VGYLSEAWIQLPTPCTLVAHSKKNGVNTP
jgi:hypothetical protein